MFTLALVIIVTLIPFGVSQFKKAKRFNVFRKGCDYNSKEYDQCKNSQEWGEFLSGAFFIISFIVSVICISAFSITAVSFVKEKTRYKNQVLIVEIQQQRIARLKSALDKTYKVAKKRDLLFNSDSPIKTLIEQLSEAEKHLALAKTEKITAKNYIESIRDGQMWLVAIIYGAPK